MERPVTKTTEAQERLIRDAEAVLEQEPVVLAAWVEGSLASGTADAWSDVDLHIAVEDSDWDGLFAQRLALLGSMRPVLGHGEAPLPWGAHLVFSTLSGPVRVDLYLERRSRLSFGVRKEPPRMLFDRGGIEEALTVNWQPEALARIRLTELLRGYFFGNTWPVRLWGRQEWGTLFANALIVVYQFLVPAILLVEDQENFFRPHFHNERHLSPTRRAEVDGLVARIRDAFRGVEDIGPDFEALAAVHATLVSAVFRQLRAACSKYDVAYPADAETEIRAYYQRELGIEISA